MYKFFEVKGTVMDVSDEVRAFAVKDKNGVPIPGQMKDHRITVINVFCQDQKRGIGAISCRGFDLPSTFVLPKPGEVWECPDVISYDGRSGLPSCDFRG